MNGKTEMSNNKIPVKIKTKLRRFASALAEILAYSQVAPESSLRWTIIANPGAGGFTIGSRWKNHEKALAENLEKARKNHPRKDAAPSLYSQSGGDDLNHPDLNHSDSLGKFGLIATAETGHAMKITRGVIDEMSAEKTDGKNKPFHLFITAGGDGTSLEVLQILYHAPAALRNRCVILRLPLGTGNDGAEAWELEDALELLIKPVRVHMNRGLRLTTATKKTWANGDPFLAFNILSLGLDAFVTHMTNKMKGKLPGDSYKLWVDISSLLYDRIFKVRHVEVTGYDKAGKEIYRFREKILLCAMGASGRRSYGSHKMILPDDRNVCAIKQMPLFRKFALKGLFSSGGHINKPESILFSAERIVISGVYPVLAQMDGETVRLEKPDFPAAIELTEAVIPVLRLQSPL